MTSILLCLSAPLCSSLCQCLLGVLFRGVQLTSLCERNKQSVDETEVIVSPKAVLELKRGDSMSDRPREG